MNQPTINSSFTNNSSASSNLSPLAEPGERPQPPEVATAVASLPKATRKSKSQSTANAGCPIFRAAKGGQLARNEDRCRHYTATGRRCRLTVLDPASGLCFRHVGLQFQPTDEDLSPAFTGVLSGFQSASRIHDFLTQLTVLLVQNRISTRRAAILAYLGQTLLRTLPAIEQELEPVDQIIFDLPRPKHDDISPEPALAGPGAQCKTPVAANGYDGWSSDLEKSK